MGYEIIEGDCVDVMRGMDDDSVDSIVTDPPYGIGFKYDKHKDDPKAYEDMMVSWIREAGRVVKPGGCFFVWQAQKRVPDFHKWFPGKYRIVAACKNFVQIYPGPVDTAFDPVVVWWKEGGKPYKKGTASRDWFVADTTPSGRKRRGESGNPHPCPRPIEHMDHVVDQWTPPGGVVLDPFCGSGTTGISCVKHGRDFIGIELSPEYADLARKRIDAAMPQGVAV